MSLRPYLLGAVALALAAAVVWDYWPDAPDQPKAPVQVTAKPVPVTLLNPLSQRPAADFAALFDHPLFDPTRTRATPLALPVAQLAPDAAPTAPPTSIGPAQPVLMGTVTSPWPGGVYLGDDQGGPVVFLRPGEAALGLHLEEARPDSALFMGPDGEVTLTLHKAEPAPDPSTSTPAPQDPIATDPNATDLGAMAPGAVDPSMTEPGTEVPATADPAATAPAPMPEAVAPNMPAAP